MLNRNNISVAAAYIIITVALSGCGGGADYWQRADVREAIRFDSEYSQTMLDRDIAYCDYYLKGESKSFNNLNECMEYKGWEKIKNMPAPAKEYATKAYIQNEKEQSGEYDLDDGDSAYINL